MQSQDSDAALLKHLVDYYRNDITPVNLQIARQLFSRVVGQTSGDVKVSLMNSLLLNKIIDSKKIAEHLNIRDISKLSTSGQVTLLHLALTDNSTALKCLPYYSTNCMAILSKLEGDPHSLGVFLSSYVRLHKIPANQFDGICKHIEANKWSFIPKHILTILTYAPDPLQSQLCVSLYPLLEVYSRYGLWFGSNK
jgi:hypothetical protein